MHDHLPVKYVHKYHINIYRINEERSSNMAAMPKEGIGLFTVNKKRPSFLVDGLISKSGFTKALFLYHFGPYCFTSLVYFNGINPLLRIVT